MLTETLREVAGARLVDDDGHEETLQLRGRPALFAGGDVIRGAGTVVEAVRDGRRAARAIDRRLRGG